MSLQLSSHKPRHLQYAEGGLRGDYRLLEVDDTLLQAIQDGDVVIKGAAHEDVVLCTRDKTYALKLVETTNTLLLLPQQEELDDEFAVLPSMPTPGKDSSAPRDVGLQTQLQKGAAAKDFPPLIATATAQAHLEPVEIMPCLDALPQLLGKPYNLDDEEAEQQQEQQRQQQQAASDAMDVDADGAAAGPSSTRPEGCHTTDELLQLVQASRAELLAELARLQAVQLGPFWRLVDPGYLGALLEMLVVSAMERGWDLGAPLQLQDVTLALQPEGYRPALIHHCLQVFGTPASQQQQQEAHDPAAAGDAATPAGGDDSSPAAYVLSETAVCLHYARKLLQQKAVWPASAFMAAWAQEVPGGAWCPSEAMLAGEALVLQPEPGEGWSEPRLRRFPASALPGAPGPRFEALFAALPRWTREQLEPYLAGLKVPGQTVDMLLLKYARASQRSPTDPTVVFVAR